MMTIANQQCVPECWKLLRRWWCVVPCYTMQAREQHFVRSLCFKSSDLLVGLFFIWSLQLSLDLATGGVGSSHICWCVCPTVLEATESALSIYSWPPLRTYYGESCAYCVYQPIGLAHFRVHCGNRETCFMFSTCLGVRNRNESRADRPINVPSFRILPSTALISATVSGLCAALV